MDDLDRRPTEFELYGNQPRVHEIAFNVRLEITEARRHHKDAMRRRVHVNYHHRVSGRELYGDYYLWHGNRCAGGSHCTNPPKSPTARWLVDVGGFVPYPF
jgi:hypothetical protein